MSAKLLTTYAKGLGLEVRARQAGREIKHTHDRAIAEDLYRHGAAVTKCPPDSSGESFEVSWPIGARIVTDGTRAVAPE